MISSVNFLSLLGFYFILDFILNPHYLACVLAIHEDKLRMALIFKISNLCLLNVMLNLPHSHVLLWSIFVHYRQIHLRSSLAKCCA